MHYDKILQNKNINVSSYSTHAKEKSIFICGNIFTYLYWVEKGNLSLSLY